MRACATGSGLILPSSLVHYDGGDALHPCRVRNIALDESHPTSRQTRTGESIMRRSEHRAHLHSLFLDLLTAKPRADRGRNSSHRRLLTARSRGEKNGALLLTRRWGSFERTRHSDSRAVAPIDRLDAFPSQTQNPQTDETGSGFLRSSDGQ